VAPSLIVARAAAVAGRSRTNASTPGRPTTRTIPPSSAYAVRQPAASINAWAIGGNTTAPTALPDSISARAAPRRFSNQLETARVYAICAVPLPTMPSTTNTA
jgi:hypothetical protein